MNKLIAFSALLAAGVAFGGTTENGSSVDGGNVFGVLRIDTSAAETIIAVPWVEASGSSAGTTIGVTNIVMTANLNEGDELWYYDTSDKKYLCWQLDSTKIWQKSAADSSSSIKADADQALSRGGAILLKRKGTPANAIFLFGQVPSSGSPTTTLKAGAWTLVAPPTAGDTNLNGGSTVVTWANVNAWDTKAKTGDQIIIPGKNNVYVYNDSKWGYYTYSDRTWTFRSDDATVTAGTGFWYHAKTDGNSPTITWLTAPSTSSKSL